MLRGVSAMCIVIFAGVVLAAPSTSSNVGQLHALVIKATWEPQPWTGDQVDSAFRGAAGFVETGSFGQVQLDWTQTRWLPAYDAPVVCDDTLTERADAAAKRAGYDLARYNRLVYLVPASEECSERGASAGTRVWLVGELDSMLVEHELGHTFGMGHAAKVICSRGCRLNHYGDDYDVMGMGTGDYGALQKAQAGWLASVTHVDKPGTYRIAALEQKTAESQAMVITTGTHEYWVDHREAIGNDSPLAAIPYLAPVFTGVQVHQAELDVLADHELPIGVLLTNGRHGPDVLQPRATFSLKGTFALVVTASTANTVDVHFRWVDRTKPSRPTFVEPQRTVRTGDALRVSWKPAHDAGSGVLRYVLVADGKATTTDQLTETLGRPARGLHRLKLVAIDRAGNRSTPAARTFRAR
ncbi:MAG: hypothetical protein ACXVRQ_11450 [Gaiellaceae bacterium]